MPGKVFGEKTLSGLEVSEGEPGQVSKKLMKTQALHAKAQMCDASSTDQKASLPLAQHRCTGTNRITHLDGSTEGVRPRVSEYIPGRECGRE